MHQALFCVFTCINSLDFQHNPERIDVNFERVFTLLEGLLLCAMMVVSDKESVRHTRVSVHDTHICTYYYVLALLYICKSRERNVVSKYTRDI